MNELLSVADSSSVAILFLLGVGSLVHASRVFERMIVFRATAVSRSPAGGSGSGHAGETIQGASTGPIFRQKLIQRDPDLTQDPKSMEA